MSCYILLVLANFLMDINPFIKKLWGQYRNIWSDFEKKFLITKKGVIHTIVSFVYKQKYADFQNKRL